MRRLETLVNVAIIATCVATIAALAVRFGVVTPSKSVKSSATVALQAGDSLPSFEGIRYDAADRTLLMFLRADCAYCAASMPFYQRLSKTIRQSQSKRVRLILV